MDGANQLGRTVFLYYGHDDDQRRPAAMDVKLRRTNVTFHDRKRGHERARSAARRRPDQAIRDLSSVMQGERGDRFGSSRWTFVGEIVISGMPCRSGGLTVLGR
jgi:hypothetical protein